MSGTRGAIVLSTIGVLVTTTGGLHAGSVWADGGDSLHLLVDVVVFGGTGLGLIYGAWWHHRRRLTTPAGRLVGWCLLAATIAVSLAIMSLYVGSEEVEPHELGEGVHIAASAGLLTGALLGSLEGVAMEQLSQATRQRVRADLLEQEREHLKSINELLRHYLLNGVNIIDGYAEGLRDSVPAGDRSAIDAIQDQTGTLTMLAEHFHPLSERRSTDHGVQEVDVDAAVEVAAADVEHETDTVVSVDGTIGTHAVPTRLVDVLELLFYALDALADGDATVVVSRLDVGPGLDLALAVEPIHLHEGQAASLFEPIGTGTGLGLYLADRLLAEDGSIELETYGNGRATFALRIRPRSS
ncbi:MAG: hypothetical protein ACOC0X_01425 [Halobacteriota archaeon]